MRARVSTEPTTDSWQQDVFLHSPDAILLLDSAGLILEANEAFLKVCGLPVSSVQGAPIADFIPAEARPAWAHDLAKLLRGDWTRMEGTLMGTDGRLVPFQIVLIAHSLHAGRPAVVLHLQDASVYRTVERALVAAQGQWERSFDAIADAMCVLDRTGAILRANQAMTARFAAGGGDTLVGRDYRAVLHIETETMRGRVPDAVRASPFVLPDCALPGLRGHFSLSAYPLKDEHDAPTGAVLILRDITEQRETAEALKKAETNQHQASKMEAIGRLAGGIAHDFNNVLTSILGYSSLTLKMTPEDDPRRKDIQEIMAAAERATTLTRQLLDFSRSQKVETQRVNLNTVISHMEQFLIRTLGETIRLRLHLAPVLDPIQADVSRLEQVLINLVANARDAMNRDGVLLIETALLDLDARDRPLLPDLPPGRYVRLQVSDNGCGMPPEVLEHLFEPFFTTKPRGKGTGLGLMTTYGIVKQCGGSIAVYSEVGKGTTFKILFPVSRETGDIWQPSVSGAALLRGHETILVVDDEPNIVTMVSQILGELGYHILAAHSSREALAVSARCARPIDLVLTDVVMPDLNGADLVRQLRQARPVLKSLFMSGYSTQAAIQIGVLAADTDVLQKPFDAETLTHRIRKILDGPAG